MHEIEPLGLHLFGYSQIDGTGIIDKDIDPAKGFHCPADNVFDTLLKTDITLYRKHFPTPRSRNFFGCRKNGAVQFGFGFDCFSRYRYIGAFAGKPQGNGLADTPAATRYKD